MLDSLPYIPLFRDLKPAQIELLKPAFEPFLCPAETAIFEQGDPAEYLYLILKGRVAIRYKPYDTPPIVLTRLNEGDVFGWSAVIKSPKYTSSIISESSIEAIRIHRDELWKLVYNHPETGKAIIDRLVRIVSPRWQNAHEQIQAFLDSISEKDRITPMTTAETNAREVQIRHLVENISAYIEQFHGGTVEIVSFEEDTLKVKLGGACLNCPLLPSTLHGWVEGTVHQFFPGVKVVEAK